MEATGNDCSIMACMLSHLRNISKGFDSVVQSRNTQQYLQTSQGLEIVPAVPLLPLPRKVFFGLLGLTPLQEMLCKKDQSRGFFS